MQTGRSILEHCHVPTWLDCVTSILHWYETLAVAPTTSHLWFNYHTSDSASRLLLDDHVSALPCHRERLLYFQSFDLRDISPTSFDAQTKYLHTLNLQHTLPTLHFTLYHTFPTSFRPTKHLKIGQDRVQSPHHRRRLCLGSLCPHYICWSECSVFHSNWGHFMLYPCSASLIVRSISQFSISSSRRKSKKEGHRDHLS